MYPCRALIVAPGGFATLDILFELLTLKQTGKIKIDIPVVMFGKAYWQEILNFQSLMEYGSCSFHFPDFQKKRMEKLSQFREKTKIPHSIFFVEILKI